MTEQGENQTPESGSQDFELCGKRGGIVKQVVLVTGCSSGIGRHLVTVLSAEGYQVVATARRVETLEGLPAALTLPLDVTDPSGATLAVSMVRQRLGRLDALVNNAGLACRGVLEDISEDNLREIFEVNVFGPLRLCRAALPVFREQGSGTIVNIGSIASRMVLPVNGAYSATKAALEAFSDALRMEVAPFGIRVILVKPGNIRTPFAGAAAERSRSVLENHASPYQKIYQRYCIQADKARRNDPGPDVVAQAVVKALKTPSSPAHKTVAAPWRFRLLMALGDNLRNAVLGYVFRTKIPTQPRFPGPKDSA